MAYTPTSLITRVSTIMQNFKLVAKSFPKGIVLSVSILLCLCGCTGTDTMIVKKEPLKRIGVLSDTVVLSSQVLNLTYFEKKYYLSDFYRGIISISENFDKVTTEDGINALLPMLPQCYMFSIDKYGEICIFDSKNKCFLERKRTKNYEKRQNVGYEVAIPSRFIYSGDSIICPIIENKMTGAIFRNDSCIGTCFPAIQGYDDVRKPYHSQRIILKENDKFFTIGKGLPIVQEYTSDKGLISSYDLRDLPEISRTYVQEKSDKPNSFFVIVRDAYAYKHFLYLLISSKDEGKYKCNRILKIDTSGKTMQIDGFYEMSGEIYSTLCVNGAGELVVVNSKESLIELYKI